MRFPLEALKQFGEKCDRRILYQPNGNTYMGIPKYINPAICGIQRVAENKNEI